MDKFPVETAIYRVSLTGSVFEATALISSGLLFQWF
jgi:hypothetical protein